MLPVPGRPDRDLDQRRRAPRGRPHRAARRSLQLHPLVLEDILNTAERPKIEDYGDYLFVVLKVFDPQRQYRGRHRCSRSASSSGRTSSSLSRRRRRPDLRRPVRDRIRKGKGRIRKLGADYLAYALIDAIVDNYFVVLERLGEKVEDLEDELVADPSGRRSTGSISLKREMIYLRKSVWPLREVISGLERLETPLIKPTTDVFLRDVYDHIVQVIDTIETFRDILSGMLETYLSSVCNRMNEVMKVLTIIATIFIPLTFLVGVYGMNFRYMPELEWRWGYFVVWGDHRRRRRRDGRLLQAEKMVLGPGRRP